jgi:hypothetical protein
MIGIIYITNRLTCFGGIDIVKFQPGFRFSIRDFIVLAAAFFVGLYVYPIGSTYSILVGFVVGHFFLFCNIVRMSRHYELIWAAAFLCLIFTHFKLSIPSFTVALMASTTLTIILVALEARSPGYHGIFWEKVNPNLPKWFSKQKS